MKTKLAEMTFKEKDSFVKAYLRDYREEMFVKYKLKEEVYDERVIIIVEHILEELPGEDRNLLEKEYLEKSPKYWWQVRYSKTNFYRYKNRALNAFIDILKKVDKFVSID